MRGVAVNLLMIGRALLALGRAEEARERLWEGLELAEEVGDEDLHQAMREAATVSESVQEPFFR